MKRGGVLDGFPMHLLVRGPSNATVLIMDDPELGFPQVSPPSSVATCKIVAVSSSIECLRRTKQQMEDSGYNEIGLIQADPTNLPFYDHSIAGILILETARQMNFVQNNQSQIVLANEITRIQSHAGWIAEIAHMSNLRLIKGKKHNEIEENDFVIFKGTHYPIVQKTSALKGRRYFIRPASGVEYFVTNHFLPSSWPFKFLELGKLKRIRISIDLLVSRLGLRLGYDSVCVAIHSQNSILDDVKWEVETCHNSTDHRATSHRGMFGLFVKTRRNALLLGLKTSSPTASPTITKIPLSHEAELGLKSNGDSLVSIRSEVKPHIQTLLPEILKEGSANGQAFWVETRCPGNAATRSWWRLKRKKKTVLSAFNFLLDLHQSTRLSKQLTSYDLDNLLGNDLTIIQKTGRALHSDFDLTQLISILWHIFEGKEIALVRTHGDFSLGNILISGTGDITGIPDWEGSVRYGWPLLDLINLITFQHKQSACRYFGSIVNEKLMKKRLGVWEYRIVNQYCELLDIQSDLWVGFVAIFWIKVVSLWIRTAYNKKWLMDNAIKPFPKILQKVTTHYA